MAARKALWIPGTGGTPSFDAIDDRSFLGALFGGSFFDAVTPGSGMRGRGHGVLTGDAMAVTTTGANTKTVNVARGMGAVRGTAAGQLGCYLVSNDATVALTLADRSGTQTRRDLLIAQVRDNTYGVAGNDWQLAIVQGTNGSASDPAVPASSLVLARARIPAGANPFTVDPSWLDDLRPQARSIGGITPLLLASQFPNPQDFDFVWETNTSRLLVYLDGTWNEVARDVDANWTSVTPNWAGSFTVGGGTQYLRYVRYGKTVTGVAGFERNPSAQSGNLVLDLVASGLPAVQAPGAGVSSHIAGARAFDASAGRFWSATGTVDPVSNRIQNFTTAGGPVWSATQPFPWTGGDHFRLFFNYEAS